MEQIPNQNEFEHFCYTLAYSMHQQGLRLSATDQAEWLHANFVDEQELKRILEIMEELQ